MYMNSCVSRYFRQEQLYIDLYVKVQHLPMPAAMCVAVRGRLIIEILLPGYIPKGIH